jgi:hypothetical protein
VIAWKRDVVGMEDGAWLIALVALASQRRMCDLHHLLSKVTRNGVMPVTASPRARSVYYEDNS